MQTLLHFTATWAECICGPNRDEVAAAATALVWRVLEVDIDAEPDMARANVVMNVPAVAVEGSSAPPLVGARLADAIAQHFRESE